ncbi:MAG: hypothetical protein CMD26_05410 [Flavobacteriales bacterium]|nr:hypothetical protein [Flavobacteriales bacterium]|tara:strand:- start:2552 stop:3772 length:1221 start_codon:yes stop_codon:yes gene_type:complete
MLKLFILITIPFGLFAQTPCLDAVANASGVIGEFIPQCEDDGSYSPMQCWGSTGYCWCVDVNGIEIPGTSLGPGEGLPDCVGQSDTLDVLFIGNSYTMYNNLPSLISSIASSMGDELNTDQSLLGGASLQSHTNNNTTTNLIMSGNWDYVVLQEQSQYPSFPLWQVEQDVFPYASQLNNLVNEYNECGRTVFFMTWGRENGDQNNCENWPPVCTYEGMDDLLRERYMIMADNNNALASPVGAVWRFIRDSEYDIDLYIADGSHPSVLGSYVAAICFYTTLFQKNPLEIPWDISLGISENTAQLIHEAVKQVVYDSFEEWNIESNDIDNDGICNNLDNCPETYNPLQEDFDFDNTGDECDGLSIIETPGKTKLIRIIDFLGRDVETNKGFQFEIYDDGSVDKKYLIK